MQKIQLSIPEPCHENWNNMTPVEQGRFCDACAKKVVDFSAMSDAEVLKYFSTLKNEKVCGRAFPDQLDREIALTKEVQKKKFWYLHYLLAMVLSMGKTNDSKSQKTIRDNYENVKIAEIEKTSQKFIKGEMVLPNPLQPKLDSFFSTELEIIDIKTLKKIEDVQVTIIDEENSKEYLAMLNSNQRLKFKIAEISTNKNLRLMITSNGYGNYTTKINHYCLEKGEMKTRIYLQKLPEESDYKKLDSVIVKGYGAQTHCDAIAGGISIRKTIKRTMIDSVKLVTTKLNNSLKIYPNPVSKGNFIHLELKLNELGNFGVEIIDLAGRVVLQKELNAPALTFNEQIPTDAIWSSGIYFIRIVKENKLISTARVLIK